jgi:hypothetical protein
MNKKPTVGSTKPNQPGLIRVPHDLQQEINRTSIGSQGLDITISDQEQNASISNHDNSDASHRSTRTGSVVMGKLCRWALALIKYKVGADGSVNEHMARVLASWLRLWGITIYTETEL